MKIDLRSLLAGEYRQLSIDYAMSPSYDENDASSVLYMVRFTTPLAVRGEITNTAGYMRMTLSLSIDYVAACARCLCDVPGSFSFDVEKTVVPEGLLANIKEGDEDDYAIIHDGFLDMDAELLELLELSFPSKLLCSEDCKGLCPKCGSNLNEGDCSCEKNEVDPRMLPLKKLWEEMQADQEANPDNQK